MCKFTLVKYFACKHKALRTSARHTLLCREARHFGFRQGFDTAPGSCFPLPDTDMNDKDSVATINHDFGFCDFCLNKPHKSPGVNDDFVGEYRNLDTILVEAFEERVQEMEYESRLKMYELEYHKARAEKSRLVKHEWLRAKLLQQDTSRWDDVFSITVMHAGDWADNLENFISQKVSRDIFDPAFRFAEQLAHLAEQKAWAFSQFSKFFQSMTIEQFADEDYQAILAQHGEILHLHANGPFRMPDEYDLFEPISQYGDLEPVEFKLFADVSLPRTPRACQKSWTMKKNNLNICIHPPLRHENLPEVIQIYPTS